MKDKVIKIGVSCVVAVIFFGIGWFGGKFARQWWRKWKEKNTRVIRIRPERAEIYDRNGKLLVGNRDKYTVGNNRRRYAAGDGKFAAGLLGFTEFQHGIEVGKSGVERMIDRKQVPGNPVYVSIDDSIQKRVENWMEELGKTGKFEYMYTICLNSQGELAATAQRPVLDINERQKVEGGTCLFPAVYVIPVPDEFMKLLGSSTEAKPEEKAKFNFHRKLGVFSPEARGRVRSLNAPETAEYAQTATAFNFLLAYIGAAEKKPIPPLQIFSSGRQPAIELKDKIGWFAVNVSGNKVIALGKAREHSGSWLYFLLCLESQNTEIFPAVISKIRNF